jgi:two-component system OmpR family response regulator
MDPHILIIATESSLRTNLSQHLRQEGLHVSETDGTQELMTFLDKEHVGLILLDLQGLKRNGIAMMRLIRQRFPQIKIITINSGDQLDLSIESMRLGAFDDFLIPFHLEGLMARIRSLGAGGSLEDKPEKAR